MTAKTVLLAVLMTVLATANVAALAAKDAPASTPEGSGSSAPTEGSPPLEEITVLGRLRLEAKITDFVYGITALENYEGAARWQVPVCPQVTGLPKQQGEFVLERISEVAQRAGVRLAGERCRPNLFVFITTQPAQLLKAMESHYYAVSFGNAPPMQVDEFIRAARPVKVWHSPYWTPGDGSPMAVGLPPSVQFLGGGLSTAPMYSSPGELGPSRLFSLGGWAFGNTYVIVDQKQLRGVSAGQFADYVSMVSLAEIKPTAHIGDVQSILSLFGGGPQSAPPRMSDWDLSFLKSLYGSDANSTMQRSEISRGMMRDLIP